MARTVEGSIILGEEGPLEKELTEKTQTSLLYEIFHFLIYFFFIESVERSVYLCTGILSEVDGPVHESRRCALSHACSSSR